MAKTVSTSATQRIAQAIIVLRDRRVILDRDLADIYGVTTKRLNEQVKRNAPRFPSDFVFQVTVEEAANLRSQFATLESGRGQHRKYRPYAFTEHGAIMTATVINSPLAVEMSIYVVRAFVQLRNVLASNEVLGRRLNELEARIEAKLSTHDQAIAAMLAAIRELMSPTAPKRRGIGFAAEVDGGAE